MVLSTVVVPLVWLLHGNQQKADVAAGFQRHCSCLAIVPYCFGKKWCTPWEGGVGEGSEYFCSSLQTNLRFWHEPDHDRQIPTRFELWGEAGH